jgi:predicted metal-dependent peptidase
VVRTSGLDDLTAELRQRWAASRVWAARQAPYLATALLALEPVIVASNGAAQCDFSAYPVDRNWHVYIDPAVLERTDVPTLGFWLVHQVSHLLRRHADRYPIGGEEEPDSRVGARTPEQRRWNMASDAEINDDLFAGELALSDTALTPADIRCPTGWLAEQYWDALEDNSPRPSRRGRDGAVDARGHRDCGSGCDGRARPWNCGRPGLSAISQKLVAHDVAQRIREHRRQRGDVGAGWQRWADDMLEPSVSWQRVLSSAVRRAIGDVAGRVDFTYRRPSRRASAVPDVVLPSLRQPLPEVAMVLDTSGSMSDQILGQVLAEVSGVLRGLGVGRRRLRVVCCDATAYEAQRVVNAREVCLLGGGDTDMRAGLEAASALKPRPDLVIVLTDGHTPWPHVAPGAVRVIVGLMDPAGAVPDWATAVIIEPVTSSRATRSG